MNRRSFLKITGLGAIGLAFGAAAWRVGGVWWDQPPAPGFAVLSADEATILQAMADAIFPGDPSPAAGRMPNGATVGIPHFTDHYLAAIDETVATVLRALIHAIDDVAVLADLRATRFHRRPRAERVAILEAWDSSRIAARRSAFRGLKLLIATAYCEDPAVLAASGIRFGCGGAS